MIKQNRRDAITRHDIWKYMRVSMKIARLFAKVLRSYNISLVAK